MIWTRCGARVGDVIRPRLSAFLALVLALVSGLECRRGGAPSRCAGRRGAAGAAAACCVLRGAGVAI